LLAVAVVLVILVHSLQMAVAAVAVQGVLLSTPITLGLVHIQSPLALAVRLVQMEQIQLL
jgi:hypothetical protein